MRKYNNNIHACKYKYNIISYKSTYNNQQGRKIKSFPKLNNGKNKWWNDDNPIIYPNSY